MSRTRSGSALKGGFDADPPVADRSVDGEATAQRHCFLRPALEALKRRLRLTAIEVPAKRRLSDMREQRVGAPPPYRPAVSGPQRAREPRQTPSFVPVAPRTLK